MVENQPNLMTMHNCLLISPPPPPHQLSHKFFGGYIHLFPCTIVTMLDDKPLHSSVRYISIYSTPSTIYFFFAARNIHFQKRNHNNIICDVCNGMPPIIIVDRILCCACMEPFFGNHGDQTNPPPLPPIDHCYILACFVEH